MKPLAPVTRQTSSRSMSTGVPRRDGVLSPLIATASGCFFCGVPRRRSVDTAMSRTTAQFLLPEPSTVAEHDVERLQEAAAPRSRTASAAAAA